MNIRLEIGLSEQVAQAVQQALAEVGEDYALVHIRATLRSADWVVSWWMGPICMGAMFGAVPSMHVAMRAEFHSRWLQRGIINEFLSWYFCNFVLAEVEAPTPMAARILRGIGFHQQGNKYIMTRHSFARLQGLVA
jgi:hypothetical protein